MEVKSPSNNHCGADASLQGRERSPPTWLLLALTEPLPPPAAGKPTEKKRRKPMEKIFQFDSLPSFMFANRSFSWWSTSGPKAKLFTKITLQNNSPVNKQGEANGSQVNTHKDPPITTVTSSPSSHLGDWKTLLVPDIQLLPSNKTRSSRIGTQTAPPHALTDTAHTITFKTFERRPAPTAPLSVQFCTISFNTKTTCKTFSPLCHGEIRHQHTYACSSPHEKQYSNTRNTHFIPLFLHVHLKYYSKIYCLF